MKNNLNPSRLVFIKTYGCQMNEHDSERILSHLQQLNFYPTKKEEEAHLILFNTCAIRDHANEKFYSQLGEIKRLKVARPDLIVGVGGCIGQLEGDQLLTKYRHLDFVFGTDRLDDIVSIVKRICEEKSRFWDNHLDHQGDYSFKDTKIVHKGPRAFVSIMKGCNNFCSYCIVPYTRGREKSRPFNEVVADVKRLVEVEGVQEITLLGQNVNSYHGDPQGQNQKGFTDLLAAIDEINGLSILRYTTSHPRDMSAELIAFHGQAKRLSKHLHLPVQSGSNSVLERMNRGYTVEHYLSLLYELRKVQPQIVISSDIIVGFPDESESEFLDTMKLLQQAGFDFIYSYAFSPRPGTLAAKMPDSLENKERSRRLRKLQLYQLEIQEQIRQEMVGKRYTLLVEGQSEKAGVRKWKGRTNCMRLVHFPMQLPVDLQTKYPSDIDLKWKWVEVEVTSSTAISAQGRLLSIIK